MPEKKKTAAAVPAVEAPAAEAAEGVTSQIYVAIFCGKSQSCTKGAPHFAARPWSVKKAYAFLTKGSAPRLRA